MNECLLFSMHVCAVYSRTCVQMVVDVMMMMITIQAEDPTEGATTNTEEEADAYW